MELEVGMEAIGKDLRRRVVDALEIGNQSRVEVARRFSVSNSWIGKLMRRWREEGTIEPRPRDKVGRRSRVEPRLLKELVAEQPDATLVELSERLRERHGIVLHPGNVSRRLIKLGVTLKKKSCTHRNDRRSV